MPYKLRMGVISSQEALEIYMVQRHARPREEGDHFPSHVDGIPGRLQRCDVISKVEIVDIGQKKLHRLITHWITWGN